jgi:hypothetical protein
MPVSAAVQIASAKFPVIGPGDQSRTSNIAKREIHVEDACADNCYGWCDCLGRFRYARERANSGRFDGAFRRDQQGRRALPSSPLVVALALLSPPSSLARAAVLLAAVSSPSSPLAQPPPSPLALVTGQNGRLSDLGFRINPAWFERPFPVMADGMHSTRIFAFIASFLSLIAISSPSSALPASVVQPSVELNRVEAQRTCHHYRWSSRRHCTSANVLRFVARPPLYYPHKYFGGTPHYAELYGYPYYWGYHHRWRYWRHRYHHPFY